MRWKERSSNKGKTMSRISTFASNTLLIQRIFRTQQRVMDGQIQVSSEKKSQVYQGIANASGRLLSYEHTRDLLARYTENNQQMDVRLNIQETVFNGVHDLVNEFKKTLRTYDSREPKSSSHVKDVQDAAFRDLKSLQDLLNTSADGRYLFSGSRVTSEPVDFGLTSLSAFQTKFDGSRITVPTTRDAHLADFSISTDTNNLNKQYITDTNFLQFRQEQPYDIDFTSATKTITAKSQATGSSVTGVFTGLAVNDSITIAGSTSNNATFTVATVASDGSSITVAEAVTAEFDADGVAFSGALVRTPGTSQSTVEASSAMFSGVQVGTTIDVTNTSSNNGTYSVASVSSDGRTMTIQTDMLTDESSVTGVTITYPDPDKPTSTLTISATTLGALSFARSTDTITSAGTLNDLPVGTTFTLSGTEHNDKTYTVKSNAGSSLVIDAAKFTDEGTTSANSGAATFSDMFSFTDVRFDTSDNSIEIRRSGAATAVTDIFENLGVGNQITVTNSDNNNGTYTIASVSSDRSKITVTEALSTTETDSAGVTFAGVGAVSFNYESLSRLVFTDVGLPGTDTIQIQDSAGAAITTGVFSNLKAGQQFTVSGAATGANNRVYTIGSISSNGSTLTVKEDIAATVTESTQEVRMQVFSVDGTVAATNYYSGDETSLTHRTNKDRSFNLDFTAIDPAIEKAVRAMMLIAQGKFGSEGGLDRNNDRVGQALYLINSSLDRTVSGTPPFGTELVSNLAEARITNGFNRVLIKNTNERNQTLTAFFDAEVSKVENINQAEVITRLLDDQQALEASFQVFSRIRQLSLTNFI
jgi:flagellar hook-associated protein 3 FlgL